MKQRLVDWARDLFRALPVSMERRRTAQQFAFRRFGRFFEHLPAYQLWVLQSPELANSRIASTELPGKRAAELAKGGYRPSERAVLMVSHSRGGGTEKQVQELAEGWQAEGVTVWGLRSFGHHRVRVLPITATIEEGLIYEREAEFNLLVAQLQTLGIRQIHVHHALDFGPGFTGWVLRLAEALAVPLDFTAHDYFTICPRFSLYDDAVRGYCGLPDVKRCTGCVATFGSAAGREVDMPRWRAEGTAFLQAARQVFVPDADVSDRLLPYAPDANFVLRPHRDDTLVRSLHYRRQAGEPLKLVTIGAIAPHKGSMVLYECALDAKKRGLPLEFSLIGFSDIDWKLKQVMPVTGAYKPEELEPMLRAGGFHAAFFPAVWPETYNYTLTEVWQHGLFAISFDIGAIARRIRTVGHGAVLDYHLYRDAAAINDALLALKLPDETPIAALEAAQVRYPSIARDYYTQS